MHRSTLARATLTATLAACFSSPVFAEASSRATLSQFTVTLVDLNLNDGVAPAITFLTTGYEVADTMSGYAGNTATNTINHFAQTSATPLAPMSGASSTSMSQASASLSGGSFGTTTLTAQGSAAGTLTPGAGYSDYGIYADIYAPYAYLDAFSLSANTMVMFSLNLDLQATTTVGGDAHGNEWSTAEAGLMVGGPAATGGNGYQEGYDSRYISAQADYVFNDQTGQWDMSGQQVSLNTQLGVSFANQTEAAMAGYLWGTMNVFGSSSVTAVPEPQTHVLVLGGLAMIGSVLRRRRR